MNYHIGAKPGEVAERIIISGDPLRAKHMAETLLSDVFCFNTIRGMLGFTGMYQGKRISLMGTGIGIPSTLLYVHELIINHGVKQIIRAGTIGALTPQVHIGDLIMAMSASTDNPINRVAFSDMQYAATADFDLLNRAVEVAKQTAHRYHVGQVFSTDQFYNDTENRWQPWIAHGILGVEMETSALYTIAAKHQVKALALLTVSDNIATQESTEPAIRERQFDAMFHLAAKVL